MSRGIQWYELLHILKETLTFRDCLTFYSHHHKGVNCEQNLDECLSNPCQNGGTCDDRNNGYVCYCPLGYAGLHCDLDVAVCDTGNQMIKYLCPTHILSDCVACRKRK